MTTIRTLSEIMAEIEADTLAQNPSLCDWSLNSMNRKTNIPIAMQIQKVEQRIAALGDSQNVLTATGDDLEDLVADRGLTRLGGTKAVGQVVFTRQAAASADIVIPRGTQVMAQDTDGEGPVYFTTIAAVTLLTGTTSIAADVEASAVGVRGNVRAAGVASIPGGLAGIDAVTNPLAFTGGADEESDADLRQRYILVATEYGRATVPTMKEWLEAIDDDGTLVVREAKVYNKGAGDIEVIADITASETNIDLVIEALEECVAAGVACRGMLAAHLEASANEGDLGDTAGGRLWVRVRSTVITTEDSFDLDYVNQDGATHTAAFVVPAGAVEGQCILGTLEEETDEVVSVPDTQGDPYAGSFIYDALIGYGDFGSSDTSHPYLFLTPEKVGIDVTLTYIATATPESDLDDLIEASITALLDDYAIGEDLQFSDIYDACRMQYLGEGEWGGRFEGIDEITSLTVTDGVSTITLLGEKITVEGDARIDPGDVAINPA